MGIIEGIKNEVHDLYWNKNINCARAMIAVLSQLLNFKVEDQLFNAGIGMHGAGGYRAQCGLVEGSLMFIGAYFSEQGRIENEISNLCYNFARLFVGQFGSLICKDLRPIGFNQNDPPHYCENITIDSILFTYKFIANVTDAKIENS